ncbi:MAG: ECF transporter S component [Clostridiales bacterium]|nr:ECF transporter S component [Clostridiales bacterium]
MSVNAKSIQKSRDIRSAIIRRIVVSAILTAMAAVLMFLEVPLTALFIPSFLKFDFSEIPVLVGAFALGPLYGVLIEFLKNLIHLPVTGTSGVGELSNFLVGSMFVFTAGSIYKKMRTRKGALIALICGTLLFTLAAIPLNWFLNLPLYEKLCNLPTGVIIEWSNAVNPLIKDKLTLILWAFIPFNLFKGIVVSAITFAIYKPISNLINRTYKKTRT